MFCNKVQTSLLLTEKKNNDCNVPIVSISSQHSCLRLKNSQLELDKPWIFIYLFLKYQENQLHLSHCMFNCDKTQWNLIFRLTMLSPQDQKQDHRSWQWPEYVYL